MTVLSEPAQELYNKYLLQVRSLLRWLDTADATEVEEDVREHIEQELNGKEEPVSANVLDEVLERLGNPRQWIQAEELSWWRRFILSLWDGPEDWRLAWISFGLLLASSFFPIFLIASFCVSRAALALVKDHDELGSQKWLIYPSMIIVCVLAGLFILFWPMVLFPVGIILTGVWWIILGMLYPKFATYIHMLYKPLVSAETLDKWARRIRRIGKYVVLIGMAIALLAALTGVAIWLFGF